LRGTGSALDMERLKIINNIRRFRFENGEMTQRALAERVGVTRQTILAIEKAKYSPTLELAILIARALGKTLDEVFVVDEGGGSSDEMSAKEKG
jgi:putative transcriptional regulator